MKQQRLLVRFDDHSVDCDVLSLDQTDVRFVNLRWFFAPQCSIESFLLTENVVVLCESLDSSGRCQIFERGDVSSRLHSYDSEIFLKVGTVNGADAFRGRQNSQFPALGRRS